MVARDANGFELGREVVAKNTWLSREDPRVRNAADGGRRRPLFARALERRQFMHRCLDAAAALVDGRNAGVSRDADRIQNPWGRDPHSEQRLQRSRGPNASAALSDPTWHVPSQELKAHAAFMAERIALGLCPGAAPQRGRSGATRTLLSRTKKTSRVLRLGTTARQGGSIHPSGRDRGASFRIAPKKRDQSAFSDGAQPRQPHQDS